MEKLYLKDVDAPREWCSGKVNLKSYFRKYSKLLNTLGIEKKKKSEIDVLQRIVPQANQLSNKELAKLMDITKGVRLCEYSNKNVERKSRTKKSTIKKSDDPDLSTMNQSDEPGTSTMNQSHEPGTSTMNRSDEPGTSTMNRSDEPGTSTMNRSDEPGTSTMNRSDEPGLSTMNRSDEPGPSTSNITGRMQGLQLQPDGYRKKINRIITQPNISKKREVIVSTAENIGRRNLVPKKDYAVSFRIHEPFKQKTTRPNSRPGPTIQQIWLLANQRLSDLKDKIICESDFQDVRGDISNSPDEPPQNIAKDVYPSSMFYIDNTFYIDMRSELNLDYSEPIRAWAADRDIELGETVAMEDTLVCDLNVRLGYPYLYMHQGCCEHLVIINDAKLLTVNDSLYAKDYPLVSRLGKRNLTYCMTCSKFPARWVVRDCDRLAHDPTFQCKKCFKMFHYVRGKKVGKFKAYLFLQRSTIC